MILNRYALMLPLSFHFAHMGAASLRRWVCAGRGSSFRIFPNSWYVFVFGQNRIGLNVFLAGGISGRHQLSLR